MKHFKGFFSYFRDGSVDVKYSMLFTGDVDYSNKLLEDTLKNKLTSGTTLGSYVLDSSSIDVYGN